MFARKFREYLFSKEVPIYQEKMTLRSIYFQVNYDWEVDISLYIRTGRLFLREYILMVTPYAGRNSFHL